MNIENEFYYDKFKTPKAKALAREINDYLYYEAPYKEEVEDSHIRYKNGIRTDRIGYVSSKGRYKFATLTLARRVVFVLHLGRILHTERAQVMQKEIDDLLGKRYADTDNTKLTPGEVYIRLEWIDSLEQIKTFIDAAYYYRLEK